MAFGGWQVGLQDRHQGGFRVWGLGFRGLGFGVSGLGFGV